MHTEATILLAHQPKNSAFLDAMGLFIKTLLLRPEKPFTSTGITAILCLLPTFQRMPTNF
jgi:hypothetical protein